MRHKENAKPPARIPARIIAIDLDDTLLRSDLTVSDYTVRVLQRTAASGIHVVLCSGRTDSAILPFVRRLGLAGSEHGRYIIAQNGATVLNLHSRREIYARTVAPEVLVQANRLAAARGLTSEVYDSSTIFVPEDNEWARVDVRLTGLRMEVVADYEDFLRRGHPKLLIPGRPEQLLPLQDELRGKLGGKCVVFTSKPYFLEVLPMNCGKGEALEWLSLRLGIDRESTMAFGDSMNDESMLRYAAHGTAMSNGLDAIKALSRHVTERTNDDDGLAHFIEERVLQEAT